VVSGPSGSGKTTLLKRLLRDRLIAKKLARSVSYTTRSKRPGERQGRDYFFITRQEFRRFLREKKIIEWTKYLDNYYATPRGFAEKQLKCGKVLLLCLDVKGASRIKRLYARQSTTIFILPPSLTELRKRITSRCCQTKKKEIKKRLSLADAEIVGASKYDYCLLNKDLNQVTRELKEIILTDTKAKKSNEATAYGAKRRKLHG